jgi:hypothetical protein
VQKVLQNPGIFLNDKKEGSTSRVYAEVPCNGAAEIAALAAVRYGIRPKLGIYRANTDGAKTSPLGLTGRHALIAQKAFIQTHLGLAPQVVVNSSKDHNNFVAGIGGFTDQAVVVGGLPGLNMANNEPASIPWP